MIEHDENVADFYLGRGRDAKYLGTAGDCSPGQLAVWVRFTADDPEVELFHAASFSTAVLDLMNNDEPVPEPDHYGEVLRFGRRSWTTWPHEYDTSAGTAWTYSFDKGSVFVDRNGFPFAVIYCNGGRNPVPYPTLAPVVAPS